MVHPRGGPAGEALSFGQQLRLLGGNARLLESWRSVRAISTDLCPQSQAHRAGFDAEFDCSTEKSYMRVAAAGGLIVSSTTIWV
jgi:hypothetical protein